VKRAQVNHKDRRRRFNDILNIIGLSHDTRWRILTEAENVSQIAKKNLRPSAE
jgi:hypothetical protein